MLWAPLSSLGKPGSQWFQFPGAAEAYATDGAALGQEKLIVSAREAGSPKSRSWRGHVPSEGAGALLPFTGAAGGLGPPWLAAAASPGLCLCSHGLLPAWEPLYSSTPPLNVLASAKTQFPNKATP